MLPTLSRDFDPATYGFWRPLLRQLDEMFDSQTSSQDRSQRDAWGSDFSPSFEADETDSHYVMSFDIPGVHREDLNIELIGNRLLVSGERKSEGRKNSRRFGRFQQAFTLPDGISADGIVAEHKDGVLRLALRKPEASRPTKIKIADGTAQNRNGGFFKNLVGDKKAKDAVEIKGATVKSEPEAATH